MRKGTHTHLGPPPPRARDWQEGPCFCIWEAEKGKTKEDMVAFIDTDEASPATDLINVVHMIDPALSGGKPPLKCAF